MFHHDEFPAPEEVATPLCSTNCATCGWPRLHHRESEGEGLVCPHQRKRKTKPRTAFAPREA